MAMETGRCILFLFELFEFFLMEDGKKMSDADRVGLDSCFALRGIGMTYWRLNLISADLIQ